MTTTLNTYATEKEAIEAFIIPLRWEPVHEPKEDGEESGRDLIYTAREVEIGNYLYSPATFRRVMVVVNPNGTPKMVFIPKGNYADVRKNACNMVAVLNEGFVDGTGAL